MADDLIEHEYEWTGPGEVWCGRQAIDGSTPLLQPGDTVTFADAVHGDGFVPVNAAATDAAEVHAEATVEPLAGRVADMKVAEVLPLLDELGPDELADVRAAEEAGKGRATVLARIDELVLPDEPEPDDPDSTEESD